MDIRSVGNSPPPAPSAAERAAQAAPPEAPAAPAAAERATPPSHAPEVTQALKSINDLLQSRSPDLEFSVDHDSARPIVKVVDTKTHEVIRQMPTQEALDIAKALDRLESMLIRQTA